MSLSVVIIEDEIDIADLLAMYCRREGWTAHLAADGERGLETIRARQPDVVLLDVGLPGTLDGFGVCRELRATSNVPVLFLTARDHEIDRIVGLEMGADDYVTKPFSPREVIARIKAILRRKAHGAAHLRDRFRRICLGRAAAGSRVGLLAAGLLAVNYIHLRDSHFATTDSTAATQENASSGSGDEAATSDSTSNEPASGG